MTRLSVAIIGGGMIGRAWAAKFCGAGMDVAIWSRSEDTSDAAASYARSTASMLKAEDLLPEDAVLGRVRVTGTLEEAVDGAHYVQESFPEDLELKCSIFSRLDAAADADAIIASSASALLPSAFMAHLDGRRRCLIAHPINPPVLIPATEVVPSPWTADEVIISACKTLEAIGQTPLVLRKELDGFVVNRLQGALLNEAVWLVAQGYASIEDVDIAVREGLALRWSFMGPFETIDLNAPNGIQDYMERYNGLYENLYAKNPKRTDWNEPVRDLMANARRRTLPLDQLEERQAWRDQRLMALATHKREAKRRFGG